MSCRPDLGNPQQATCRPAPCFSHPLLWSHSSIPQCSDSWCPSDLLRSVPGDLAGVGLRGEGALLLRPPSPRRPCLGLTRSLARLSPLPLEPPTTQRKLTLSEHQKQERHLRVTGVHEVYPKAFFSSAFYLITTLQSLMNAKLSKHRFWHCHENGLIKTIQSIPHNL